MCLRFVFLLITRVAAWLRLSRRADGWKTAEILILRLLVPEMPSYHATWEYSWRRPPSRSRQWLFSSGDEVLARSLPTARRSTVLAAGASRAARTKATSPRTRGARHWEPTDNTGLRGTRRHGYYHG